MKSDYELIDYIKKRKEFFRKNQEENEPHGDDRFKHIYYGAKADAMEEILLMIEG